MHQRSQGRGSLHPTVWRASSGRGSRSTIVQSARRTLREGCHAWSRPEDRASSVTDNRPEVVARRKIYLHSLLQWPETSDGISRPSETSQRHLGRGCLVLGISHCIWLVGPSLDVWQSSNDKSPYSLLDSFLFFMICSLINCFSCFTFSSAHLKIGKALGIIVLQPNNTREGGRHRDRRTDGEAEGRTWGKGEKKRNGKWDM